MKIAVKEVGKDVEVKEVSDFKYRGDIFESIVKDAYVESVTVADSETESSYLTFCIDEDGLLKNLPFNFLINTNNPLYPIQKIVGTAVFMRIKKFDALLEDVWDYEPIDLTERDLKLINKMLDRDYQLQLRASMEKGNGSTMDFIVY